jgi:hypothetical protein
VNLDRIVLRTAPLVGLVSLSWLAYRMGTARLFNFKDGVSILCLFMVLFETWMLARKATALPGEKIDD